MGFNLMRNFHRPYFSKSISEFWKRWHISLSTWFRDYVYIPLGGSRVSVPRWYVNLMLVFLLSGLWHGANWTFVVWGGLHGFYLVFSLLSEKFREKLVNLLGLRRFPTLHKIWQVLATFCLVLLSWVFFRARSVGEAFYIISGSIAWLGKAFGSLGQLNFGYFSESWAQVFRLSFSAYDWAIGLLALAVLLLVHFSQRGGSLREKINQKPTWFRWSLYYGLIIVTIIFGYYGTGPQQFIYFQF
jgi:D-alanyl-lipoteichoic acid acyltransferase DltB (MBOAT superfamily)